jgi:hypothetical protein
VTFPEQQQPTVSTPEELLARGDMPQIPYVKTSRVPEGFEPLEHDLVAYLRERVEGDVTSRTLTMHAGRVDWVVDDPDVPRVAKSRHALFAVALTEGGEPAFWCWAFLGTALTGYPLLVVSDFTDEATARAGYLEATTDE